MGMPSSSGAEGLEIEQAIINPCQGCSWSDIGISTTNGTLDFVGGGGTLQQSFQLINLTNTQTGLMHGYFNFRAPDNTGWILNITDCGIFGCSSPFAFYPLELLAGSAGQDNYQRVWNAGTQTLTETIGNAIFTQSNGTTALGTNETTIQNAGSGIASGFQVGTTGVVSHTFGSAGDAVQTVSPGSITDQVCADGAVAPCSHYVQTNTGASIDVPLTVTGTGQKLVQIGTQTFSVLAACASGTEGTISPVTDSTTATWGATITGGGTNHVLAYCDGSAWTVAAK